MPIPTYDLVVIGSGPAGQKGAIAAAKLGKKVAIVDKQAMVGGVSLHSGTIPSKTLREAVLYLTGLRQRAFYGKDYALKQHITTVDLQLRVSAVIEREMAVVIEQLRRNDVTLLKGMASFVDAHTLEISGEGETQRIFGEHILIACGTRPARSPEIPLDGSRILLPDQLNSVQQMPHSMTIVGAGVIGLEYASMLAALDIQVTLIDQRPLLLEFVDHEIIEALSYHLRSLGMIFRLGEKVIGVSLDANGSVITQLDSGKRVHSDMLLYAVGRQANTDLCNLPASGVSADARGKITVNEHYQTAVPHIYAAGDVIGFPALASTSMEQGRVASHHMFGNMAESVGVLLPLGIYTIPEISTVGKSERELTEAKINYEVGIARYEELAKSAMLGDQTGMLKILFCPKTLKVLGVHAIGDSATEIISIGQCVMALGGTMEYFRDTVFNYPTFAETYKVAALNGLNKL